MLNGTASGTAMDSERNVRRLYRKPHRRAIDRVKRRKKVLQPGILLSKLRASTTDGYRRRWEDKQECARSSAG
ncbi:protein of unknown function [Azospirillum baldaniorum]|uniref:Uncharacterized protein n=1 Tax=Azospirillum baldaniorum TaxID=1064539 RepID=A0A9P1JNH0_9PROT|nr:protein of unknown function [Azospirillum baldaniorum]